MQKSKTLKLVIDTNLWISFIISRKQNLLGPFLFSGKQEFYSVMNLLQK